MSVRLGDDLLWRMHFITIWHGLRVMVTSELWMTQASGAIQKAVDHTGTVAH